MASEETLTRINEAIEVNGFPKTINVIVDNGNVHEDDLSIFDPHVHECDGCQLCRQEVVLILKPDEFDLGDLIVSLGLFPSKSQARKNWNRGEIKTGWNHWEKLGRFKAEIAIWNPGE